MIVIYFHSVIALILIQLRLLWYVVSLASCVVGDLWLIELLGPFERATSCQYH